MRVSCYCGEFELHYKKKKQLLRDFTAYCSGDCLLLYLKHYEERANYSRPYDIALEKLIYPSQMMVYYFDYYCKITKRSYRSKSEATFAIWCEVNQIIWEYEPYTIRFNATQSYTPDFWLPESMHFVEVKGVWAGSAKKKMRRAAEHFSLILVPDYLIRGL